MKISLFNPFKQIAGMKAFAIGLPVILLSSVLGYLSHTHFDGAIDSHMGDYGNIYVYISEGLIDYVSLLITFYIAGIIISGFHFRFIDMMGTVALSRVPLIFVPLAAFAFPQQKISDYLNYVLLHTGDPVSLTTFDIIAFMISVTVMIIVVVWMVVLLVNAYKICVNKKGVPLVISFILAIIAAEIISKIAIVQLFPNPVINNLLVK
jgi:hypothetical protein